METQTVACTWQGQMTFRADMDGHSVIMDANPEVGGQDAGPRPKPLTLASLGGCTGMDVVSLLHKMRMPFEHLAVQVSGELTDEHPRWYHRIHITYQIRSTALDMEKLEKAIRLSQEKYCGVSALLRRASNLTYSIEVLS